MLNMLAWFCVLPVENLRVNFFDFFEYFINILPVNLWVIIMISFGADSFIFSYSACEGFLNWHHDIYLWSRPEKFLNFFKKCFPRWKLDYFSKDTPPISSTTCPEAQSKKVKFFFSPMTVNCAYCIDFYPLPSTHSLSVESGCFRP